MINLLAIVVAAEEEAGDPPNPVIPVENEIVWAAIFFFALWGAGVSFQPPLGSPPVLS